MRPCSAERHCSGGLSPGFCSCGSPACPPADEIFGVGDLGIYRVVVEHLSPFAVTLDLLCCPACVWDFAPVLDGVPLGRASLVSPLSGAFL